MARKRGNGEGSVKQLRSGSWQATIMTGYTGEGKRKFKYFTAKTKAEAMSKLRDFQNEIDAGINANHEYTFSQWANIWYQDYKSQVQPSTYSAYKYTLRILIERIGESKLKDILPMHVTSLMSKIASEGYSNSQVTKCRSMLIQIFDAAEENLLILHNAARKSRPLRDPRSLLLQEASSKDAFRPGEIELLHKNLPYDLLGHSIRLLLFTGIRVQELLAMTSSDIVDDGSVIAVNKAIKTVDGKPMLGPPKSKRGYRDIPVPPLAISSANYLRDNSRGPFIWSTSVRYPLYGVGAFRRKYYQALKEIEGVRCLSPHCCRHTYITMLQGNGVAMETIARLVGHTKVSTTDQYLHISMETLNGAVADMNFLLRRDSQGGEV